MMIKKALVQLKRELWENQVGFLWVPLVFGGLIFIAAIWLVLNPTAINIGELDKNINLADSDAQGILVFIYQTVSSVIYMLIFFVVVTLYAHSTLFNDRKSREILFWRSMPISETFNVFTKLAMIFMVTPLIIFSATAIGAILFIIFLACLNPDVAGIWSAVKSLPVSIELLRSTFIVLLLLMPVIAWNFFCSAFAKRSPIGISLSVPLGLWILDSITQRYLGFNLLFKDTLVAYAGQASTSFEKISGGSGKTVADIDFASSFDWKLTAIAVSVSVLLIMITIWLRNNRYEI